MIKLKKYLPNLTSLRHYAGTNILTNIMVLLNLGFWMGAFLSILFQFAIEANQYSMFMAKRNTENLPYSTISDYIKIKGIDCIWDTIFALLGIFATLINALKWI